MPPVSNGRPVPEPIAAPWPAVRVSQVQPSRIRHSSRPQHGLRPDVRVDAVGCGPADAPSRYFRIRPWQQHAHRARRFGRHFQRRHRRRTDAAQIQACFPGWPMKVARRCRCAASPRRRSCSELRRPPRGVRPGPDDTDNARLRRPLHRLPAPPVIDSRRLQSTSRCRPMAASLARFAHPLPGIGHEPPAPARPGQQRCVRRRLDRFGQSHRQGPIVVGDRVGVHRQPPPCRQPVRQRHPAAIRQTSRRSVRAAGSSAPCPSRYAAVRRPPTRASAP